MSIKVYTDGACKGNPGPGGWGALIIDGDSRKELYAGNPDTTNNQMEMQAAIEALKHLKGTSELIELYTDSNYLRQGITEWIVNWKSNNWRTASRKPVANRDLWKHVVNGKPPHVIFKTYPLNDAKLALNLMNENKHFGKLVLLTD